eukprot:CAMPEP_0175961018 /NCGR_PEP_ID=MMETSP0108-20121206/35694_1 /TAXON_ID=195067 ORGANISM="Goniomonas pacifica, Strain CCMP1869" /NCGR_SAMPLE_ID=MMETSP0108 /ASSEMBLY_ACC=CAM_ASM_000204 /LENGTH=106 /DNA_ID=CAMNT_0017288685 /DNA_START=306 /DNA_END=624 /DNA_ORIENTATION=-
MAQRKQTPSDARQANLVVEQPFRHDVGADFRQMTHRTHSVDSELRGLDTLQTEREEAEAVGSSTCSPWILCRISDSAHEQLLKVRSCVKEEPSPTVARGIKIGSNS